MSEVNYDDLITRVDIQESNDLSADHRRCYRRYYQAIYTIPR